jgi:hypothetical protein
MIEAVTDMDAKQGHTKAPHIPVNQIHVTDVESKPDPIVVDPDHESTEAPDTSKPVAEIGPSSLAQASQNLAADVLAEAKKNPDVMNEESS